MEKKNYRKPEIKVKAVETTGMIMSSGYNERD